MRSWFHVLLFLALPLAAQDPTQIVSIHATADVAPVADPNSAFWKDVPGVTASNDQMGSPVPGHRSEVRSRWTGKNLYFLFICPYEQLHLTSSPATGRETNKLWEYDTAEVFVAPDTPHLRRYKEFEVSPQAEWVDLDIDRDHPLPEGGWLWNSGFKVSARIDKEKKIWYGVMRIPYASVDTRSPAAGNLFRINFYRLQGPAAGRKFIAWQPTHDPSYHVPESFGTMLLK